MKIKNILFLFFILIIGCAEDKPIEEYSTGIKREIEVILDDTQTRTTIDEDSRIHWQEGDSIGIYSVDAVDNYENPINNIPFVVKQIGNKIVLEGEMYWKDYESKTCTFFAYYPYHKNIIITNKEDAFYLRGISLPENQVQIGENNNEHINNLNFVYGITKVETNKPVNFTFDNVYTLLELKIKGNILLSNIKLSLQNTNDKISSLSFTNGDFEFYYNRIRYSAQINKGSHFLNLHVEPSVQLNNDEYKKFYLLTCGYIDKSNKVNLYFNDKQTPIELSPIDLYANNQKYTLTIDGDKLTDAEKGTIIIDNLLSGKLDDRLKEYNLFLYNKIKISGELNNDDLNTIKDNLNNFSVVNLSGCSFGLSNYTIIPSNVFKDFSNLEEIALPNAAYGIASNQFYELNKLRKVSLGSFISSIGAKAFMNCINLETIENLDNYRILSIGEYAFANCENLVIPKFLPVKTMTYGKGVFYNCKSLNNDNIELSLRAIPDEMFYNCKISKVTLNNTVIIGNSAFKGCDNLLTITSSSKLNNVGNYAFANCTKLKINITDLCNNTDIGNEAFLSCDVYGTLKGDEFRNVDNKAFYDCKNLQGKLNIYGSIGDSAFYNCSNITSITLNEKVTKIGKNCFTGIISLDEFTFNSDSKLDLSSLSDINIIYNVNLYKNINISSETFKQVSEYHLYTDPISENFKSINYDCEIFYHTSKENPIIPTNFMVGGDSKPNLKLHLRGETYIYKNSFSNVNITDIYVTRDTKKYSYYFLDHLQITLAENCNLHITHGINFEQPTSLFSFNNENIKNVYVSSITYTLKNFMYLKNISSNINLFFEDGGIKTIDNNCFSSCSNIISVSHLPNDLEKIGDYAFYGTSIKKIDIPSSVFEIGDYAFQEIRNLTTLKPLYIIFNWKIESAIIWRKEIFPKKEYCVYYFPTGTKDIYIKVMNGK
ncbi:hypothetical protein EZS27_014857 [termite gut metagenome]|uniref:Uncharacterized protein n=1 Tax=termite gut metagenome TaxID=433724 RepID=A0A5J4RTH8_9ZZZZ